MKSSRSVLYLVLTWVLLLLTACGKNSPAQPTPTPAVQPTAAPVQQSASPETGILPSGDPAAALDQLVQASGVLDQFGPDTYWIACLDRAVFTLQMDGGTIRLNGYLLQQDGTIAQTPVSGTLALDSEGISLLDAEGQPLLSFQWSMLTEGEDGLSCFALTQTQNQTQLPTSDQLSFYATQATTEEQADQMARAYLENRQDPDPDPEELSTLLEGYRGVSIVDACVMHGLDPSLEHRAVYAQAFGIEDYRGTAEQNLYLLTCMGGVVESAG